MAPALIAPVSRLAHSAQTPLKALSGCQVHPAGDLRQRVLILGSQRVMNRDIVIPQPQLNSAHFMGTCHPFRPED